MRYILIILFGLSLAQSGSAQNLLDSPTGENAPQPLPGETSEMDIGIDQIKETEEAAVQPINLFTNRFAEPAGAEAVASTNKIKESKLGFLMSTGFEYADEGEYEEAEKAYLRALEMDAGNKDILLRLGTLYVSMERFKEAVEIFKGLAERFPDNSSVNNNLAWCYATGTGVKNKKLALRYAREAILSAPTAPSIWNTLAEAYYMAGDYDKALRSAEYALELLEAIDPESDKKESFLQQRSKILLAREGLRVMEGLDEEE